MPFGTEIGGPIRVLHIEDDEALAALVRKSLARRGHTTVHARDGAEGLALLAGETFDVVALDHTLPGETGLDILARMGSRATRPPVVYVTGSSDARLAVEALKTGADDYVIKDLSPEFFDLMIAALEQALERWRLKRQRLEAEKAIREARDRAELLLKEVNHRVANSLGLVAAMVRMQASVVSDPVAVHALNETQARISAVAGVHRHLYTSSRVGAVELDRYLAHLVEEMGASMRGAGAEHLIDFTADRVAIPTDKAVSLGVIVGELLTNAFKYAYEPGTRGTIRVSVERFAEGRCRVSVTDDGRGISADQTARGTGLGTRILAAMARNLEADVTHRGDGSGTRIDVDFRLDVLPDEARAPEA